MKSLDPEVLRGDLRRHGPTFFIRASSCHNPSHRCPALYPMAVVLNRINLRVGGNRAIEYLWNLTIWPRLPSSLMSLCVRWEHSLEVIGLCRTSEIELQCHENSYSIVLLCFLGCHSSLPTRQELPEENLSMRTDLRGDVSSRCIGHRQFVLHITVWIHQHGSDHVGMQ